MTTQSIEDLIQDESDRMVKKTDELVKKLSHLCNGEEAPIVIGSCLNIVVIAASFMPDITLQETAEFLRDTAKRVEAMKNKGGKPMH